MKIKILLAVIMFSVISFSQDSTNTGKTTDARTIINKYIDAIGGREKLLKVQNRITEMTGLVHEIPVRMTIFQKQPDFFKQIVKVQDIVQIVLFNGQKGMVKINEEKKDITGIDLERLKVDANMGLMLSQDTSEVHFVYDGKDTVAGNDVYKIKVITNSGSWTQFYDVQTGFKVKDSKPIPTPNGEFTQYTWYSNFKQVDGLWFPFKIIQQMEKQRTEFTVISVKLNQAIEDSVFAMD